MGSKPLMSRETALTLLHLAISAQLGVLTRVFLNKFFQLGCSGGWGPCITGGIYFPDLPSNMLGSYIIGVFAASSVVGLANNKSVAVLPHSHPWQSNFPFQIGLRTGYCGSLTTFSSWVVSLTTNAILHNTWMNALLGLIVGLYAAIASYIVGVHSALYIDRWLLADREDVLVQEEEYKRRELEAYRSTEIIGTISTGTATVLERKIIAERLSPQQAALEAAEFDIPRLVSGENGVDVDRVAAVTEEEAGKAEELPPQQPCRKTTIAAGLGLVLLTTWGVVGTIIERKHLWLRQTWIALLFAPLGCYLRWYLSRFNYRLGGRWAWTPVGTFLANMIGVATSSAVAAAQLKGNLSYTGILMTSAIPIGFAGALSTVSTFVTEIVKFLDVFPDNVHAYTYAFGTLVGGVLVVFAVYGWAGWSV